MPCYFFLLRNGEFDVEDDDGLELPDDVSARDKAMHFARGLLAAAVLDGRLPLHERVVVMAQNGREVVSVSFGQAVYFERLRPPHVRRVD